MNGYWSQMQDCIGRRLGRYLSSLCFEGTHRLAKGPLLIEEFPQGTSRESGLPWVVTASLCEGSSLSGPFAVLAIVGLLSHGQSRK